MGYYQENSILKADAYFIDVSNILYRGHFREPDLEDSEISFLFEIITELLNFCSPIFLCFDGMSKGKRLNPDYKAQRVHDFDVYKSLPQAVYILSSFKNVHIKYNPNLEADEVIYSLVKSVEGRKIIISSDNDLLQALDDNTFILRGDSLIGLTEYGTDEKLVKKFFNVPVDRLPVYRAIIGDSSDNLKPPVPRFPHKLAADIVIKLSPEDFTDDKMLKKETLQYVCERLEKDTEKKWVNKLLDSWDSVLLNHEIMRLNVCSDLDHKPKSDTNLNSLGRKATLKWKEALQMDRRVSTKISELPTR